MITYTSIKRAPDAFQQQIALEQIIRMCQRAFGDKHNIIAVNELGGGGFNNVYQVDLAGMQPVVLRVTPRTGKLANATEARRMRREHLSQGFLAPITPLIPKTLMADFTQQLIDCDYIFQTHMEGEQWGQIYDQLTLDENSSLWRQLGNINRTINSVVGPAFGTIYSGPQHKTWSQAVIANLTQSIDNLEKHARLDASDLRAVQEIACTNTAYLDEIDQPRLCHGDLWTVNILIKRTAEGPIISAVLDADGTFWGDPLADWTIFLLQLHKPAGSEAFWEAYGQPEHNQGWHIRNLIYYCQHLGNARLECWRNHFDEAVLRSYQDIQKAVTQLRKSIGQSNISTIK